MTAPDGVAVGPLLAAEGRLVSGTCKRRQQEFAAGRACARQALAGLGWPDFAVLAGPRREPLWPPGIVGSITHCRGYCAAAVAPAGALAGLGVLLGLGVDAEPNLPVDPEVRHRVASAGELTAVRRGVGVDPALLIFCAKEAAFKAWYPLTRRGLDLLDVRVDVNVERRTFRVETLDPTMGAADLIVSGRWAVGGAHVGTVATVFARR